MDFRVLIVRLSPFRDVVKSTTHQFLYGECSRVLSDEQIDFCFFPSESERRRQKELTGVYSGRPAAEFDLILVTNSYAVELLNLPYMLKKFQIPYHRADRENLQVRPLVVMGGSNAPAAQSVLYSSSDAMVDGLFIGEGETAVTRLVQELSAVPPEKRRRRLAELQAEITGLKVF